MAEDVHPEILRVTRSYVAAIREEPEPEITALLLQSLPEGCWLDRLEYRVKGPISMARAIEEEVSKPVEGISDEGLSFDEIVLKQACSLGDAVRYSCVVHSIDVFVKKAETLVGNLNSSRDAEVLKVFKIKNFFFDGNRYKGLHLCVKHIPSGIIFEVQMHFSESLEATRRTHEDYEIFRDTTRSDVETVAAQARIVAVYASLSHPPGLSDLENIGGVPVTKKIDRK